MLSGRAGQALGTDPAAKNCKKKRSQAIRAAADGRMAGIRHVRSLPASLRTWALFVLMPGHAAHDFGPEPTASELKSKVADAQTRSGVWRCHPSLENHRSEGRQAREQTGILLITCTALLLLLGAGVISHQLVRIHINAGRRWFRENTHRGEYYIRTS